jgi:bacillithiol biosynthesis cysteine-adding enzyme BshC
LIYFAAIMEAACTYLPYDKTHAFSKLAVDYLQADEKLRSFYSHPVSWEGLQAAIEARKQFPQNRTLLVQELQVQYSGIDLTPLQQKHIQLLLQPNTFTVTTAHQPNIFTGPLYFIYKILHAIKLAEELNKQSPENNFVPFYYMGSEDADLDELGHIYLRGEKQVWETSQTGAVGRMNTAGLNSMIDRLQNEFGYLTFGAEMIHLLRNAYSKENNIQQATLQLVNELFKDYGLLVLIPDNANLKREFQPVVSKELLEQFSHSLVQETIDKLGEHYKVRAGGREINLFYLNDDGRRERIELRDTRADAKNTKFEIRPIRYEVRELGLIFSEKEIIAELEAHPERFSANVILRGVFQETILPNVAFIGGGGELAYWLELKKVFEAVQVPYPVLVLRNSFLLMSNAEKQLQTALGLDNELLFLPEQELLNLLVKRDSSNQLDTQSEQQTIYQLYAHLQEVATKVDPTLKAHVAALHVQTLKGLKGLEKKLLRAERRHANDLLSKVRKLRAVLFPANNLQERTDNFMPLYAGYGKQLIDILYQNSLTIEQQFGILQY